MNYKIVNGEILFNPAKITVKEMKQMKKLAEGLGYSIIPVAEEKKEKNPLWTAAAIQQFIEENGTKKQKDDYWAKFNEPMKDKETGEPITYKHDTKDGKHKAGDIRVKGHVATLQWFKKEFPNYGKDKK